MSCPDPVALDFETSLVEAMYAQLRPRVKAASDCVYQLDEKTRVDQLPDGKERVIYVKREDTSRIHSYKWRGAYFKLQSLVSAGNQGPFVAASAGNHAQGVALAAKKLGVEAVIFMPRTTPELKQKSVRQLGGEFVTIELFGDCFDDASNRADQYCQSRQGTLIKPFDDLCVIAGQATIGLELIEQQPNLTKLYVPIGGGGLASGVAFAIKLILNRPCKIVGVEVAGQDSMCRSLAAGQRVCLSDVDVFCDGTAVREPGQLTFDLCRHLLDDVMTVTNSQVSSAIRTAWECGRFIPEPSGAISLAAAELCAEQDRNETVGVVISGANTDFKKFPRIVRQCDVQKMTRRFYRFKIEERNGTLIELLDTFMSNMNIVDFQYGRFSESLAYPVLGIEGPTAQLDEFSARVKTKSDVVAEEITGNQFSEFRVIPFHPEYCKHAVFLCIDFPDRPGALRELMRKISRFTSICYFNFVESGETEGHALIGFEILEAGSQVMLFQCLDQLHFKHRTVKIHI